MDQWTLPFLALSSGPWQGDAGVHDSCNTAETHHGRPGGTARPPDSCQAPRRKTDECGRTRDPLRQEPVQTTLKDLATHRLFDQAGSLTLQAHIRIAEFQS